MPKYLVVRFLGILPVRLKGLQKQHICLKNGRRYLNAETMSVSAPIIDLKKLMRTVTFVADQFTALLNVCIVLMDIPNKIVGEELLEDFVASENHAVAVVVVTQ